MKISRANARNVRAGIFRSINSYQNYQETTDFMSDAVPRATVVNASDPLEIEKAARVLRQGGIVAFPTETVYGLGADAFNPKAVARVFEVKKRPSFDPLIVHVAKPEEAFLLLEKIPAVTYRLIKEFWPGPLTIVLPKTQEVPDLVTAGLQTVAVRMPRNKIALRSE